MARTVKVTATKTNSNLLLYAMVAGATAGFISWVMRHERPQDLLHAMKDRVVDMYDRMYDRLFGRSVVDEIEDSLDIKEDVRTLKRDFNLN